MNWEQEKLARAALRTVSGVGSQRLRQLIAYFGSAVEAWEAASEQYQPEIRQEKWVREILKARQMIDLPRIGADLRKQGIQLIMPTEAGYPVLLAELADAPPLLYYKGHLQESTKALAIVGSRQATSYGKSVAKSLARDAGQRGIVIVSGLARGIDTAAHQGALESGGVTWAFLGCGIDRIYPLENSQLAEQILERGALLSEFAPGSPPNAAHFPARNRLISGSSHGVIVVEAAERSGALITVDFALEQGREVFAVPGPIFSPLSRGPHHLLRQGAKIVEGMEDICNEIGSWSSYIGIVSKHKTVKPQATILSEEPDYQTILAQLSDVPLHIDQITVHSKLSVSSISLALLELQLDGKIMQLPGQYYVLAREC